ncbi:MAG: ADP-forming succinate--CoA ligase subunit beta [Chloroflexi bacterium]|nr:ADP-forming succinate--CoA ligase subunit beta [Chloroflexota bacterium]
MRIHEYQAKKLLSDFGIPVPPGEVIATPEEAAAATGRLGGRVALKAQVHAGGRGKGGGIRLAATPEEAAAIASQLLGRRLVTHQTPPEGLPVNTILVEEETIPQRELYLGVVIASACPVMMASESGGMDIEEVAAHRPEKIVSVHIDPSLGFQPFHARKLIYGLNLEPPLHRPATQLMGGLYRLFQERDCSLAEINPLAVTNDGRLLALDAKLNFDDNALFRQTEVAALRDEAQENALEVKAQDWGIKNYVKLQGNIGCVVNGAGLAMATMDLIQLAGGEPANFLDIGTVNNTERVVNAFRLLTGDPEVKAILINIFGGMARVDVIATGIVEAAKEMDIPVPVVVRLEGTNLEEGRRILAQSGVKVIHATDLSDAARKVVSSIAISRGSA